MKRTLFISYIALLLPMAIACQKEDIQPLGIETTQSSAETQEARTKTCTTYSFFHKDYGYTVLGTPRGDYILVGFAEGVSLKSRKAILSTYKKFADIQHEAYADFTLITTVRLKNGTTCADVEKMLKDLETHNEVNFAKPTFDHMDGWQGVTNEFLLFFIGDEYKAEIEQICEDSGVKVLDILDFGDGFYQYTLSADKYATKDVLAMCTLFNQKDYIMEAVPNYYWKPF